MGIGFDESRCLYLLDTLAPERLTRIVDIGANPINHNPYSDFHMLGKCEVWGFEPHPGAYEKLQKAAHVNANYLPYAVGNGREAELKVCKSSGFSSLLEPNRQTFRAMGHFEDGASAIERKALQTMALDEIDELPDFDLLKIDIQGGEVDVFSSGAIKISRATAVISEVAAIQIYVDQPLFDDQMVALRDLDFGFHKFLELKSYPYLGRYTHRLKRRRFRSQVVDGDAVFVKNLLAIENLDRQRLVHLALLSDAVFDSQDLTIKILTILEDDGYVSSDQIHRYIDLLPFSLPR